MSKKSSPTRKNDRTQSAALFGQNMSAKRKSLKMTLKSLSELAGLSVATLSRIENGLLSVTYDNMISIASGLGVNVIDLLQSHSDPEKTRRSVVKKGQGDIYETEVYRYEMLHTDLLSRAMNPIRATLKAHTIKDFGSLKKHSGEEFFVVLRGEVELHAEHYAPVKLAPGDSAYFDSTMGHALLATNEEDAEIIWVATSL